MRAAPWLLCIAAHAWTVTANVEKTIFVAPPPVELPNDQLALDIAHLDAFAPAHSSIPTLLETQLPVAFASSGAPRGLPSWYLLRDLEEGRRYEVRVCWPATVRSRKPARKRAATMIALRLAMANDAFVWPDPWLTTRCSRPPTSGWRRSHQRRYKALASSVPPFPAPAGAFDRNCPKRTRRGLVAPRLQCSFYAYKLQHHSTQTTRR